MKVKRNIKHLNFQTNERERERLEFSEQNNIQTQLINLINHTLIKPTTKRVFFFFLTQQRAHFYYKNLINV